MTNILIVQGHPDPIENHLCHAIADTYRAAAEDNGHSVEMITIAQQDIPFLRNKQEFESDDIPPVAVEGQAAVQKADHVVFIYPLWMGDVPAVLKAWIEQVFREKFAFEVTDSGWTAHLKGKSARIIVTMGMPAIAYNWFFLGHSVRSLKRNLLKFSGFSPVDWSVLGNAEDPSGKTQVSFLRKAKALGAKAC